MRCSMCGTTSGPRKRVSAWVERANAGPYELGSRYYCAPCFALWDNGPHGDVHFAIEDVDPTEGESR